MNIRALFAIDLSVCFLGRHISNVSPMDDKAVKACRNVCRCDTYVVKLGNHIEMVVQEQLASMSHAIRMFRLLAAFCTILFSAAKTTEAYAEPGYDDPNNPPYQVQTTFAGVKFRIVGGHTDCAFSQHGGTNKMPIMFYDRSGLDMLLNDNSIRLLLDYLKMEWGRYCSDLPSKNQSLQRSGDTWIPKPWKIAVWYSSNPVFTATQDAPDAPWNIDNPYRRSVLQQQSFQRAEVERKQAVALEKQQRRNAFTKEYGVPIGNWTNGDEVVANPYIFKDAVVGIRADFVKMVDTNEAVFNSHASLIVRKVPSTAFRGGEEVILAIRINGTRKYRSGPGETSIPDIEYLGHYQCRQRRCGDWYD